MNKTALNSSRYINNPERTNRISNGAYSTGAHGMIVKNKLSYLPIPDSGIIEIRDVSVPNTALLRTAITIRGFLETGILGPIANFTPVSDGSFRAVIDGGAPVDVPGLNFTAATTYGDIATIVAIGLQAQVGGTSANEIQLESNSRLKLNSGTTGDNSSISVLSSTGSGTDVSGDGFLNARIDVGVPVQGQASAADIAGCSSLTTNDDDSILYVACRTTDFILTYDISDKTLAIQLFSSNLLVGDPTFLNYRDNVLYVPDGFTQIFITLDVTNPAAVINLSNVAVSGEPQYSDILDNFAVCGLSTTDSVALIDITDPATMSVLDTYTGSLVQLDNVRCTKLIKWPDGRIFCLALGRTNSFLVILEIINNVFVFKSQINDFLIDTPFDLTFLATQYCLVASQGSNGITWIDIFDVINPKIVKSLEDIVNFLSIFSIQIDGYRAFVSNESISYFSEIDISNNKQVVGKTYEAEIDNLLVTNELTVAQTIQLESMSTQLDSILSFNEGKISYSPLRKAIMSGRDGAPKYIHSPSKKIVEASIIEDMKPFRTGVNSYVVDDGQELKLISDMLVMGNNTIEFAGGSKIKGEGRSISKIQFNTTVSSTTFTVNPSPRSIDMEGVSFENLGSGKILDIQSLTAAVFLTNVTFLNSTLNLGNNAAFEGDRLTFSQSPLQLSATGNSNIIIMNSGSSGVGTIIQLEFLAASLTNKIELREFTFISNDTVKALVKDATATIDRGIFEEVRQIGNTTEPFTTGFSQVSNTWDWEGVIDPAGDLIVSNSNIVAQFNSVAGVGVASPAADAYGPISDGGTLIVYSIAGNNEKFTISDTNTGEVTYNGIGGKFGVSAAQTSERTGGVYNIKFALFLDSGSGFVIIDGSEYIIQEPNVQSRDQTTELQIILKTGDKILHQQATVSGTQTPVYHQVIYNIKG